MAKLNLNFHQETGRHEPTKHEIVQIEGLALSVEAIIKALYIYTAETHDEAQEMSGVCMGVCNALKLLIDPVISYMGNYAGDAPAEEATNNGG